MKKWFAYLLLFFCFGCQPSTQMLGNLSNKQVTVEKPQEVVAVVPVHVPNPAPVSEKYELSGPDFLPEPITDYLQVNTPLPYFGDFPLATHPRVDKLIQRYSGANKRTFAHWLERASRYVPKIQLVFADEGIPLDLAYLAMIESGFNVRAYSWAHAAGPWQFIESTGQLYGLQNDWWQDGRLDLEKSTRAAAKHLKYLYKRFDGDWFLAVAAYNAGGGKVRRSIKKSGSRDFWVLTEGAVLREETKNYLPKLLAALYIVKDPYAYGFTDLKLSPPLEYETVTLETSTDLEIIAEFCGITYAELKELNPELKRWCTPPGVKNYQLRVPFGSATQVRSAYAQLPEDQRASYHRHQIKSGDTLQVLARKYHIRVDDIIALNNISNPRALQIGQNLILPLKQGYTDLPKNSLQDSYVRSRRKIYKVRKGDSLWSIAQKNNVTQKELRIWNKLGWSNLLRPGQILVVSKSGARTVAKTQTQQGPSRKMIYHVVPGDTLWDIGRQFNIATEQILRWNELSQEHILRPGQKLTLMVSAS
ncbi:membrane-bound lytic murein transglycosylase D [Desulfuromusa kysingii]|uniref:Membrane-bound lytic murein transglycosylase D n=1 Tax=Desulfuromusa kysingii TaxID=37625 RepID=A0A1H4C1A2_9BACT|nr:LysM peptidoglycan-binding domain-containing protein [Desulfuromusa kysingii]SEA54156.1 membrane-bound lytic murein transglycosylase D [Desulfuromusa kysingii]